MIKRVIGNCTLYNGSSTEIVPQLGEIDSIVSDPPYGMSYEQSDHRKYDRFEKIHGDETPDLLRWTTDIKAKHSKYKVAIFTTCYHNYNEPNVIQDFYDVLKHNNISVEIINDDKFVPEGVEGRVPYRGSVVKIIEQLIGGLKASMGYTGNKTIKDFKNKTKVIKITSAGLNESHVHSISITRESPNYQLNK